MKKLLLSLLFVGLLGSSVFADAMNRLYVDGDAIFNQFVNLNQGASIDTSAADNATIEPIASWQKLDTYGDAVISTVNVIVTNDMKVGTILFFQTAADARDVVFIETGNLLLTATHITLDDTDDILAIMKISNSKYVELFSASNN